TAAASRAAPRTAKVLPMSRTKCRLSGPVSGTAAGRLAYQCAGATSIQAALARFARPKRPSAQNQGSSRTLRAIAFPPSSTSSSERTCRWAPQPVRASCGRRLAHRASEPGDAFRDGRLVDGGERQRQVLGATPVGEPDLAAGVGHAARAGGLVQAI